MEPACYVNWFDSEFFEVSLVVFFEGEKGNDWLVISCGRGDHYFQVASPSQYALQHAEKYIIVYRSLVHVVQDDRRILRQERIAVKLLNESAVRHEHYSSVAIYSWIESNLVRNLEVVAP